MAGLLAWAADVVGAGGGQGDEGDNPDSIPLIFTPEQQKYAIDLDQKAASLSHSINDLRLRILPTDISQRLPHLHAHFIASNADLAFQLNSHSSTREQEMEDTKKNLRDELENAQMALDTSQSHRTVEYLGDSKIRTETGDDIGLSKKAILDKLEKRKWELVGLIICL